MDRGAAFHGVLGLGPGEMKESFEEERVGVWGD